jgi:signal transduction histidine kinase
MITVSGKEARILIVDDNVSNIALLNNMLGRIGYSNLRHTTDSREVLTLVEEFKPDLIILDLMMPHLDGFQVMQQLSGVVANDSYLPVLVLTADVAAATKRKALAAGATDFLHKPFDASEIFMRIRNLLQSRFLHLAAQNQNQLLEQKVAERTQELSTALNQVKETQHRMLQQERLRAFGEMAGGVVHDFNNALMSVVGYTELLLNDPTMLDDKPAVLEYLQTMNTAGRDAAHVVGRLREFYRPREETDVFECVALNQLIEQAVSLTQPKWRDQARADGRTINIELDLEKVPTVAGNPAELREVLINLIFNAVDAMPSGGAITLRSYRLAEKVAVEVIDSGTGMSEEVRARCLEPFFSTKGDHGTGLGLSMTFGVVKRHDAEMEIESTLGSGTTFRISFPSNVKTFTPGAGAAPTVQRPLRVLVVDDEFVARDIVRRYLLADGHDVVTATSGQEALAGFKASNFDLVVTDHSMPGMNGTQLAESMKAARPGQPILMLSGFTDSSPGVREKPAGVDLMLTKPIPQKELRDALAQLCAS